MAMIESRNNCIYSQVSEGYSPGNTKEVGK
jgi:hypothetical protein